MKFALFLLAVVATASSLTIFDQKLNNEWEEFKTTYNKLYASSKEESYRRMVWERNFKSIEKHNSEANEGKHTFRQKMNKFGDMNIEEFKLKMNGFNMSMKSNAPKNPKIYVRSKVEIPDSVDWRTKGYVTPIKNQEQCGSCWAFSAVASLEGQHFKASGSLVSLSEQNLVDCSYKQGNEGCNGGLMDQAFAYIIANNGIDTEDSYPYEGVDGKCRFKAANVGATEKAFVDIQSGSEDDFTAAIANIGPIATAMDASHTSFQFYSSGVYYEPDCSSSELDHGITAVGYGSQGSGNDYYIMKNMWGTEWGNKGYVLMARNKNNNCGVATSASYPTV